MRCCSCCGSGAASMPVAAVLCLLLLPRRFVALFRCCYLLLRALIESRLLPTRSLVDDRLNDSRLSPLAAVAQTQQQGYFRAYYNRWGYCSVIAVGRNGVLPSCCDGLLLVIVVKSKDR
jgi:hypothetical protein